MSNGINNNFKNYENLILFIYIITFIIITLITIYYNFYKNINYSVLIKIIITLLFIKILLLYTIYNLNYNKTIIFIPIRINTNPIFKYLFTIKINKLNLSLMIILNLIILVLYINQRIYINNIDRQIKYLNLINFILITITVTIISNSWLLFILSLDVLNQILYFKIIFLIKKTYKRTFNYLILFLDKTYIVLLLITGILLLKSNKNLYLENFEFNYKYNNIISFNLIIILIIKLIQTIVYILLINFSKIKSKQIYFIYTAIPLLINIILVTKFIYFLNHYYIIILTILTINILILLFMFFLNKKT